MEVQKLFLQLVSSIKTKQKVNPRIVQRLTFW